MRLPTEHQNNLYLINAEVIDPAHGLDEPGEILIEGSAIKAIGAPGELKKAAKEIKAEVVDLQGLVLCPGFIDLNARLAEPRGDFAESVASSTQSAAAGGFTSVAVMPSLAQINDNPFVTDFMLRQAREKSRVRIFPIGAVTLGMAGEKLAEIGSMKEAGIVAVADDGRALMDAYLMRKALEYARAFELPLFSFAQDKNLVGRGVMDEGFHSCRLGLRGIPAAAEEIQVARDIVLSRAFEGRIHFSSISSKGALRAIASAKSEGLLVSAETSPQYFSLSSDEVNSYDARFKCFPPLRGKQHVDFVIEGLADGTIDAISSGHTPLSPSSKDMVFEAAAPGMPGFETALPLALHLVRKGKISLERMVALFTSGPAKILGLDNKNLGTIKVGAPADLVAFDPECRYSYSDALAQGASRNSPFYGRELQGAVRYTIVNGVIVSRGLPISRSTK